MLNLFFEKNISIQNIMKKIDIFLSNDQSLIHEWTEITFFGKKILTWKLIFQQFLAFKGPYFLQDSL